VGLAGKAAGNAKAKENIVIYDPAKKKVRVGGKEGGRDGRRDC